MTQGATRIVICYIDTKALAIYNVTGQLAGPGLLHSATGAALTGLKTASQVRWRGGEWDTSWTTL